MHIIKYIIKLDLAFRMPCHFAYNGIYASPGDEVLSKCRLTQEHGNYFNITIWSHLCSLFIQTTLAANIFNRVINKVCMLTATMLTASVVNSYQSYTCGVYSLQSFTSAVNSLQSYTSGVTSLLIYTSGVNSLQSYTSGVKGTFTHCD